MARISILSLALLAFVSAAPAAGPVPEKAAFRVYSISIGARCGIRTRALVGVYPTVDEAARAAGVRRDGSQLHEVDFGTKGSAVLHAVYTRACRKACWRKEFVTGDLDKALAFIKAYRKHPSIDTLLVHDHAPTQAFQIHGGGCRKASRLLGTYTTARDAFAALDVFRTKEKLVCDVTLLTPGNTMEGYRVYVRGCKGGWFLETASADKAKADAVAEARKKDGSPVEIVLLPKAS